MNTQAKRTPATVTHDMLAFAKKKMPPESTLELNYASVVRLSDDYDAQAALVDSLERSETRLIDQCDAAEDIFHKAYFIVMRKHLELSSNFFPSDALQLMEERWNAQAARIAEFEKWIEAIIPNLSSLEWRRSAVAILAKKP